MSSTEKRIYIFEKAPVRRAVLQQMLPTVAGQMVALLYNLADTFFVGLLNAPIQTAAVTVAYPPFLMMTAVSNLFGIGGASAVSHALGRRDMDGARPARRYSACCAGRFCTRCSLFAARTRRYIPWPRPTPAGRCCGAARARY